MAGSHDRGGRYPAMQSGQDQALAGRFKKAGISVASPDGTPSFIYCWHSYPGARHLSAMGHLGYERRGEEAIVRQQLIVPRWSRDWENLMEFAVTA